MRVYTSFDEIDRDLRVLQLQKEIDHETMKLQVNEVKDSLSAVSILSSIIGAIAKKAVVLKTVHKLIGRS